MERNIRMVAWHKILIPQTSMHYISSIALACAHLLYMVNSPRSPPVFHLQITRQKRQENQ